MTTQPEDLRSEPATSTDGGGQPPDVPDPPPPRDGRDAAPRPSTTAPAATGGGRPAAATTGEPPAATPTGEPARSVATGEPARSTATGEPASAVATAEAGGPTEAPDEAGAGDAAEPERARRRLGRRWRRRRWFRYTLPGAGGAVLFMCLAFTPSLLPRSPVVQGLVCGISAAIGYGVGVVAAWVWRAFADRDERAARPSRWRIFAVVAAVALVAAFVLGQRWQSELRDLMGVAGSNPAAWLLVPVAGRGRVRRPRRARPWPARGLPRGWPGCWAAGSDRERPAPSAGSPSSASPSRWSAASCWTGWCPPRTRRSPSATTSRPRARSSPPSPPGPADPESLVAWDTLGREGRKVTGLGPTASDISAFTGGPALAPIRAYAGLESADTTEARANLAVDDLERAGGFDRKYLVVATTTGSGWVDPASMDTVEYMTGGDSAIVAIQYSYLPSWISYLVDQKRAREAGRALFDAVYGKWSALPQDSRPRLLVFGESLGSFGGETAFSGEQDLRNRTSGVVFAGPPNFNTLFREFTDDRDPGSQEVAPIYRDGRTVRFDDHPGPPIEPASVAVGRSAGALPAAPVRPDRVVDPAAAADRAGLAARATRPRRAGRGALGPVRHVLAGDRWTCRSPPRCRAGTGTSTPPSTSTPGPRSCSPPAGPTRRRLSSARSSPTSTEPERAGATRRGG